jgi:hypothetical protein
MSSARSLCLLASVALLPSCVFLRSYHEPITLSAVPADEQGTVELLSGDWRIAGQSAIGDNRIELRFTAGEAGVATGGGLKIGLGHLLPTEQRIYTPFSISAPSAVFFGIDLLHDVEVVSSREGVELSIEEPRRGGDLKDLFRYIKYKRSEQGQTERDNLQRQQDNEHALRITLTRGALEPGDTLRIQIGASEGLEASSREMSVGMITRLDADGDGQYGLLHDVPLLEAYSAWPAAVQLLAPATLAPGESSTLLLRVEDGYFLPNLARFTEARVVLDAVDGLDFERELVIEGDDESWQGCLTELPVIARGEPGVYRIEGEAIIDGRRFPVRSNPIEILAPGEPHIYFGDTHTHSILSIDADRPPEDVWWRHRHRERFDFAVLTDHDMIGAVPFAPKTGTQGLAQDEWAYSKALADEVNEPGSFVSLKGYEWTSYFYGHRNIYFAPDEADPPLVHHNLPSALGKADEQDPAELIAALEGRDYLVIPHSPAWPTGDVSYHWGPEGWPQAGLVEVYSTHGASEYFDNEYAVDAGRPEAPTESALVKSLMSYNIQQAPAGSGNFVQDALADGRRFGFIGSSDMHYLSHIDQAYHFGLAGVFAQELTRESIWGGLTGRDTYATTGARIIVHFAADGVPMGQEIPGQAGAAPREVTLTGRVHGTDLLDSVQVVKLEGGSFELLWEEHPVATMDASFTITDPDVNPGELCYLRVRQRDGHTAWASPIWFD